MTRAPRRPPFRHKMGRNRRTIITTHTLPAERHMHAAEEELQLAIESQQSDRGYHLTFALPPDHTVDDLQVHAAPTHLLITLKGTTTRVHLPTDRALRPSDTLVTQRSGVVDITVPRASHAVRSHPESARGRRAALHTATLVGILIGGGGTFLGFVGTPVTGLAYAAMAAFCWLVIVHTNTP